MKNIDCWIVHADETQKKLGQIDLADGLGTFRSFPWEREVNKVEQTGCFPVISFGVTPISKSSEYLNITGLEQKEFSVMIEAFIPTTLFGFIPRTKSAYHNIDGLNVSRVNEFIKQFYSLSQQDLFEWIEKL